MPGLQTTKTTLVVWPQTAGKNGWQVPWQAAVRAASAQAAAGDAAAQCWQKSLIFRHFLRMAAGRPQNNK